MRLRPFLAYDRDFKSIILQHADYLIVTPTLVGR